MSKTPLTVGKLIEWGNGTSEMSSALRSRRVKTVWNDSRKVGKGDAFAAFRTANDDGHRYVESALKKGALCALVDKKGIQCVPRHLHSKCIVVGNTLKAVGRMAANYRKEMGILIIGITGSNGKTTTRTFISSVLGNVIKVGETYSNWNNHIGVPLSLLRFDGDEWAGVIEMGANHVNEISDLSKISKPDIALITNIGYAHVGLFGSLENTTKAKFEIADGLSADGFMLLNGDDPRLVKEAARRGFKTVFYGTSRRCDIRAENVEISAKKGLSFVVEGRKYSLGMPGRHFVYCILPAIYIAKRCRVPDETIHDAVTAVRPVSMRGMVGRKKGVSFIVDCYNANPSSMSNAIKYLCDISGLQKKRIAVVGDMLELGAYTARLHTGLGKELVKAGVGKILAVGQFAHYVVDGALKAGMPHSRIYKADDANEALQTARKILVEGDTVLLKGSRGVMLERVYEGY